MKTVQDIRSTFIDFFNDKEHTTVPSAPLVPHNDPTLMFVNSGMVPFKNLFTGVEKRDYKRATSAQKCVRAGGKHNDLDNVGYTARHHTFFEMLGNFSFGDYFKEEAISNAWDLISNHFDLPQDRLLITVHSSDEEAADLWKRIAGFSDDKIIRIPTDDNFWRMGDTGPCGPCTEIFFDQGENVQGGPPGSPDEDGDRFLEFWNLVFMQYEQVDADTRVDLPKQSIDTGMGLERMAAIIQGKTSNYDIDLFQNIIGVIEGKTSTNENASHRVIADHLRAASFLIADGVMPSNEGRGYVLRRIMRRGMRHAHLLGAQDPLMHTLFPTLLNDMGTAYPELHTAAASITQTLESEEKRFKETLERGLKMLDEEREKVNGKIFPGDVAFKLYDTYGFPLDLTQDVLKQHNITVDDVAFNTAMDEQKRQARASWSGSGQAVDDKIWFDIADTHGATEFLGYDTLTCEAEIVAIVKDGEQVNALNINEDGIVIVNQTPFYAESGGQVGDTGTLSTSDITNTTKAAGDVFLHHVTANAPLNTGDTITLSVNQNRRTSICANHSATHLLHEALRQTLGDHVAQKGSLQDENRTRFDISHPNAISKDQIATVEALVNKEINANTAITTRVMPIEDARKTGAMALFGEKYDDEVRVVAMGSQNNNKAFSVELCGGTHVKNTGDIKRLKITSESALSSGVRRIEAMTGDRADQWEQDKKAAANDALHKLQTLNNTLCAEIKSLGGTPPESQNDLEKENKKLQKMIADLRRQSATESTSDTDIETVNGIQFIGKVLNGFSPKDLKPMVDDLKSKVDTGIIALIAVNDGKASIVVGVTNSATDKYNAVDLVKAGSQALGGKGGGGRPDMAQAGGPNADKADEAIIHIRDLISA